MKYMLLFIMLCTFQTDLFGYIDPGTGSYVMQLLIAGLVGGIYAIKTYWKTIVSYVKIKKK